MDMTQPDQLGQVLLQALHALSSRGRVQPGIAQLQLCICQMVNGHRFAKNPIQTLSRTPPPGILLQALAEEGTLAQNRSTKS